MAKLRALVDEMVTIQTAMGDAALAAREDASQRTALVTMRKRFARQVLLISQAIDGDEQLNADPELAAEFRRRFSDMRSKIALHQAKWPAVLLDNVDPAFIKSAETIIASNHLFAGWALATLKG
jgi:hypothetical protein